MNSDPLPLGPNEKCYALETKEGGIILVRHFHSERWPFLSADAQQLALGCKEIQPGETGRWAARELKTPQELKEVYDRLKAQNARK
jgi:hypothetical protein